MQQSSWKFTKVKYICLTNFGLVTSFVMIVNFVLLGEMYSSVKKASFPDLEVSHGFLILIGQVFRKTPRLIIGVFIL